MRIQHNILALNAYRNYNNNTSALGKNLEKLSSGYKINRAGDDAAGLAISEKMRAQITGLSAAQKNVKDGISLVKTAEGAMQEIHDMLNRMDYLATQSANGTYQDPVDRENLQKEVDSLRNEINRIADSSNFNGINLLDGSLGKEGGVAASYEKLDSAAIQNLMLAGDSISAADVGSKTILETDTLANNTPGFTISLNGVSHIVKDVTDANNKFTIKIETAGGPVTYEIDETDLAADYSDGAELTSADLAAALVKKSATVTLDGVDYDVTAEGENLVFTAQDPEDLDGVEHHYTVTLNGVAGGTQAATKSKYETTVTAGSNANSSTTDGNAGTLTVTTKIDGQTVTFTATGQSDFIAGAGLVATSVPALTTSTQDADGNAYVFADYFTASFSAGKLTFESKTSGANAPEVTNATYASGTTMGTGDNATSFAAGTATAGADPITTGTTGYVNYGTEVVIDYTANASDQLASTTLNLTGKLTDGTQIKLGDETYTIAIGDDSAFAGVKNAVKVAKGATEEDIANALTVAAKDNSTFTVSHIKDTAQIGIKQKMEVKDSTDMSTRENFASYIGISTAKKDADGNAIATASKPLTLQIGDTSDDFNQLSVAIGDMHVSAMGTEGGASIADIDISNQKGAQDAIQVIKDAINYVSSIRGDLGATQNRLEHTANNLSVMAENIQDAESTIRDTDVAEEMMAYTKNNILVQAAQAMLAQANAVPQGVLQLLQ